MLPVSLWTSRCRVKKDSFVKLNFKRPNKCIKQTFFTYDNLELSRKAPIQGILQVFSSKVQSIYHYWLFLNKVFRHTLCNLNKFTNTSEIFLCNSVHFRIISCDIQVHGRLWRYHSPSRFQKCLDWIYVWPNHIFKKQEIAHPFRYNDINFGYFINFQCFNSVLNMLNLSLINQFLKFFNPKLYRVSIINRYNFSSSSSSKNTQYSTSTS